MTINVQQRRVLVLGDGTALGAGGGEAPRGIPYWIASEFPHSAIDVRAESESRVHDLPRQFPRDERLYDALLIICGGLDVLHFTPIRRLATVLREALGLARERSPLVIVANSANFGAARLLQWPLNALSYKRSLKVGAMFSSVCRELDVRFVDFTLPRQADPIGRDAECNLATNDIHPSAEAYALCYRMIRSQTPLRQALAPRD